VTMDAVAIQQRIPHRYPFLMVDRIVEHEPGKRAVGIKNVTVNEPHFTGHYPERPVMPGVLILEAIAQVGGLIFLAGDASLAGAVPLLAGVDKARFRRMVVPGDQLRIEATVDWFRKGVAKVFATATVDGEVAATAEVMFALQTEAPGG
jgi:3-hydroxyacyl-[acyl-carrier-protein] dehydratase